MGAVYCGGGRDPGSRLKHGDSIKQFLPFTVALFRVSLSLVAVRWAVWIETDPRATNLKAFTHFILHIR